MPVIESHISLLVFVVIGIVLPFLIDLVTKRFSSGALKSSLLLGLSLVSGVLVAFLGDSAGFDWKTAAYGAVTTFITGTATFCGFTSPVGLSGSSGVIQAAVPQGIGHSTTNQGETGDPGQSEISTN